MRWNDFAGSLVFAGGAAALLPAAWLLAAPLIGGADAIAIYLAVVAAVYVAGLGRGSERRAAACWMAGFGALGVALLCDSPAEAAVAAALLVSSARVLLFSVRPLRAIAIEAGLLFTGFAAASLVAGSGPLSIAFALCAYLLVQSAYFLIGAGPQARRAEAQNDFAQARDRLLRLLDEGPV